MNNKIKTARHPFSSVLVEPKISVEASLDEYCNARDEAMLREPMMPAGIAPHATLAMEALA